jgi:hypothetical protein
MLYQGDLKMIRHEHTLDFNWLRLVRVEIEPLQS